MSAKTFFTPDARKRVTAAIGEVERQTAAEVVVALRDASAQYRHLDYLVGFAASFAGLCIFLFAPQSFRADVFPIESLLLFAAGSALSAFLPPLRRLLASRKTMDHNVNVAARAAFVELGVATTRGRTGILVFVSMLERRVVLVSDLAIDEPALGQPWKDAKARLDAAVATNPGIDRFLDALLALGPLLARALPRSEDDVNELPDEVDG